MSTATDETVFCRDCGAEISERAEICPECGIRQREPKSQSSGSEKDSGIAAVCSFLIPGLGQVYNGEIAKGIILGIITIATAITIIGLIIAVPLWIFLVYDAYKVAVGGGAGSAESSSTSVSTTPPRAAIERALTWRINRGDDPENAEAVRERFRNAMAWELKEEDKEYILKVVREHDRATGSDSEELVQGALD